MRIAASTPACNGGNLTDSLTAVAAPAPCDNFARHPLGATCVYAYRLKRLATALLWGMRPSIEIHDSCHIYYLQEKQVLPSMYQQGVLSRCLCRGKAKENRSV